MRVRPPHLLISSRVVKPGAAAEDMLLPCPAAGAEGSALRRDAGGLPKGVVHRLLPGMQVVKRWNGHVGVTQMAGHCLNVHSQFHRPGGDFPLTGFNL